VSTLIHFNYMLFQDINGPAGDVSWLDAIMIFCASYLIFLWPLFLLVVWGLPLSWRQRSLRPGEADILHERRAALLWLIVACGLSFGLDLFIEQFYFEPRPFVAHKVHLLVQHAADASFPSDHTAWSFAVVGMLLFAFLPFFTMSSKQQYNSANGTAQQARRSLIRKLIWFVVIAFVIGCIIGYARVFVGVHYPDDILGGAVDGLIAALIITLIRRWLSGPTDAILRFIHTIRLA
jgi:undecaprenyl-diphosphatase